MKRILVFGMTENPGGVESFLINYYRNIDKTKIQFDFLCNSHDPVAYEEELLALGGRTFHITARSRDRALYKKEMNEVFTQHAKEWDAIWVNVSSLANIDYLKVAKDFGIRKRIIHSHNSRNMDSRLRGLLHKRNRSVVGRYATDFWACSEDAAEWFYNGELLTKTVIIHNAIDVKRVAFDAKKREAIREQLGILEDEFVIGNVGRLHFQKNQAFALDVFRKYLEKDPASKLVFVGQGEDEQMLKEKCGALGITDRVIFSGVQSDIQAFLSAFDLFFFPSVFEGLGIAALEAEANGLSVLTSKDVVPADVQINPNVVFIGLDQDPAFWADQIAALKEQGRLDYDEVFRNFTEKGYEITHEIRKLEELLLR